MSETQTLKIRAYSQVRRNPIAARHRITSPGGALF